MQEVKADIAGRINKAKGIPVGRMPEPARDWPVWEKLNPVMALRIFERRLRN